MLFPGSPGANPALGGIASPPNPDAGVPVPRVTTFGEKASREVI